MPPMASAIHDGVSCDSCMKSNFRGDRFKCLRCYDFDLCRECYETSRFGAGSRDHTVDHPVQCVMTQQDFEVAYWGELGAAFEESRVLVFTCAYCGQNGFNRSDLYEHVNQQHHALIGSFEVICPVCLASPTGDPNQMTDDLAVHLASDHIARQDRAREEETSRGSAHRRQFHPRQMARRGRPVSSQQSQQPQPVARTPNAQQPNNAAAVSGIDPIAELLTQLGGIRRASSNYSTTLAQIQQLQQQLGRRTGGARRAETARSQQAARYAGLQYDANGFAAALEGEGLRGGGGGTGGESQTPGNMAAHLWSELVAGVPFDSGAFSHMLRVAPPSAVQPPANQRAAAAAVQPDPTQLSAVQVAKPEVDVDPRFLAPRLLTDTATPEQMEKDKELARERSEFIAELILSMTAPSAVPDSQH